MEVKEEVSVKKKRNWLFTLFACVMTGLIVFLAMNLGQKASKVIDPDTKGTGDKSEEKIESNSNETSNEISNENSNVTTEEVTTNSYEVYAKKLKENFSKFGSSKQIYEHVSSGLINRGYDVKLDGNGTLTVTYNDPELNKKFNNYKIADNVLSFYVIGVGMGGGQCIYFIYEDGTVGIADTEYGVSSTGTINVRKETEYKDIVIILQGFFSGADGTYGPIFIDINGNVFNN